MEELWNRPVRCLQAAFPSPVYSLDAAMSCLNNLCSCNSITGDSTHTQAAAAACAVYLTVLRQGAAFHFHGAQAKHGSWNTANSFTLFLWWTRWAPLAEGELVLIRILCCLQQAGALWLLATVGSLQLLPGPSPSVERWRWKCGTKTPK